MAMTTPKGPKGQIPAQRTPVAARFLQSPPATALGSNDDKLERAQARAARVVASRRKSIIGRGDIRPNEEDLLGKEQIMELFQNCIKLASENKINQRNTWELSLIDHLSDIIKVEDDDTETNFQKASCTLETGVKIYALRVDSTHSEAFKVLGGINRAGREDEGEISTQGDTTGIHQEESVLKKETEKKASPLSTLESSFEALNLKNFDVAFTVDPLYHQTSAQFDEGGAKGLLLHNLGVYGGCRVLFDSSEVPGKIGRSGETATKNSETIDISFARDCVEKMMVGMSLKNEISPTLREILQLLDEENQMPFENFRNQTTTDCPVDESSEAQLELEVDGFDGCEPPDFVHEYQMNSLDDHFAAPMASIDEDALSDHFVPYDTERGEVYEEMDYLIPGLAFTSKSNSWAGPDHWKYRKVKGPEPNPDASFGSQQTGKKSKKGKREVFSIDFTNTSELQNMDLCSHPKNEKSILLPANRIPTCNTLPEDCHYQPDHLVKLFLIPNVMCVGGKQKAYQDESRNQSNYEQPESWDDECDNSFPFAEGDAHSDVDDSANLVSQPRQVNKIEVQYDKASKQVDVHALKRILWDCMQEHIATSDPELGDDTVSFRSVLSCLPRHCSSTATKDVTAHLCFICLLHLANEHNLSIQHSPAFDELFVKIPAGSCKPGSAI